MKNILYLILTLSVFACSEKISEIDKIKNQISHIHDVEAMPKMSNLVKIAGQLKKVKQQLQGIEGNETIVKEISSGVSLLEAAEGEMMEWMREYSPTAEGLPNGVKKIDYFKKEQAKIERVKKNMLTSMEQGEKLLKKYMPEM